MFNRLSGEFDLNGFFEPVFELNSCEVAGVDDRATVREQTSDGTCGAGMVAAAADDVAAADDDEPPMAMMALRPMAMMVLITMATRMHTLDGCGHA